MKKVVSIIRDRGQLTIPDSIRKQAPWANPMSAVTITLVEPQKLVITPQRQLDWDEISQGVKQARAIRGEGSAVSAAEFIAQDRKNH